MASSKSKLRRTSPKKSRSQKKSVTRFGKWLSSSTSTRVIWFLVLLIGIQLLCLGGWYVLYKKTILSFKTAPVITYTTSVRAEEPVTISLPTINISLPLTPTEIINGIWQTSDTTATHLASSARPGENGNIVIYGHNRRHLFANLKHIKLNDEIVITTSANKVYTYKVTSIDEVVPEAIETVLPTDHEVVTVYTCSGWYDQYRLVIKATPQSVQNI